MFENYLAAALRNLLRNRAYTAINLFGLSLGFAAALIIARNMTALCQCKTVFTLIEAGEA